MNRQKLYVIPFVGLKIGIHEFEYQIEDAFFTEIEFSPIKEGNLVCYLEFNKQTEGMFLLKFTIQGKVKLTCDRCNELFDYHLNLENKIIVKVSEDTNEGTDELLIISQKTSELDVMSLIYEFIILGIPLLHVHPSDINGVPTCDPEFLAILDKYTHKSTQEIDLKEEKESDPRWDALKKINKN